MSQYFTYNDSTISIGDTVRIHQEVQEGDKKRTQVYEGIVIAIKGAGAGKSFTVRKIASNSIGVEKIFPVALPSIQKIEVKRKGAVKRAKLYYLRDLVGKAATRITEKKTVAQTASAA
jgi:large subunit ribosomal protein L19